MANGTYSGTPTYAVAGALVGATNKAVQFNGTDAYVTFTGVSVATNGSWEVFFKVAAAATGTLLHLSHTGPGQIRLQVTPRLSATVTNDAGTNFFIDGPFGKDDGNWHHVVLTRAGTAFTMYCDGVQVAAATVSGTITTTLARAGADNSVPAAAKLTGSLDEVAFYDTTLDAATVVDHYNKSQAAGGGSPTIDLSGTSTATGSTSGALSVSKVNALAGASAGTAVTTGALRAAWPLTGTSLGAGSTAGAVSGGSAVASTVTAELGTADSWLGNVALGNPSVAAVVQSLTATSAGVGVTTGALGVRWALAGSSTGTSTTTAGVPLMEWNLGGVSAGVATTTGNARMSWRLGGTSSGVGLTIGALAGGTPTTPPTVHPLTVTVSPHVVLGARVSPHPVLSADVAEHAPAVTLAERTETVVLADGNRTVTIQ